MIEVRPAPPEHYGWIAERAHLVIGDSFRAIEALNGDRIVAMVGYDGWTPNSCSMHMACDEPIAARRIIRPAFGLVFDPRPKGYGLGVALGAVLSTNPQALALDLHLGFREVARLRDAFDKGVDLIILEMRRENCRWLKGAR